MCINKTSQKRCAGRWKERQNNDKNDENINNSTTNSLFPGVSRGTRSHEKSIFEAQKTCKTQIQVGVNIEICEEIAKHSQSQGVLKKQCSFGDFMSISVCVVLGQFFVTNTCRNRIIIQSLRAFRQAVFDG